MILWFATGLYPFRFTYLRFTLLCGGLALLGIYPSMAMALCSVRQWLFKGSNLHRRSWGAALQPRGRVVHRPRPLAMWVTLYGSRLYETLSLLGKDPKMPNRGALHSIKASSNLFDKTSTPKDNEQILLEHQVEHMRTFTTSFTRNGKKASDSPLASLPETWDTSWNVLGWDLFLVPCLVRKHRFFFAIIAYSSRKTNHQTRSKRLKVNKNK